MTAKKTKRPARVRLAPAKPTVDHDKRRDDCAYWLQRVLPAFNMGVMATHLQVQSGVEGWEVSIGSTGITILCSDFDDDDGMYYYAIGTYSPEEMDPQDGGGDWCQHFLCKDVRSVPATVVCLWADYVTQQIDEELYAQSFMKETLQ